MQWAQLTVDALLSFDKPQVSEGDDHSVRPLLPLWLWRSLEDSPFRGRNPRDQRLDARFQSGHPGSEPPTNVRAWDSPRRCRDRKKHRRGKPLDLVEKVTCLGIVKQARRCRQQHDRQGPQFLRSTIRTRLVDVARHDRVVGSTSLAKHDQSLDGHRDGTVSPLAIRNHLVDDQRRQRRALTGLKRPNLSVSVGPTRSGNHRSTNRRPPARRGPVLPLRPPLGGSVWSLMNSSVPTPTTGCRPSSSVGVFQETNVLTLTGERRLIPERDPSRHPDRLQHAER